LPIKISYYKYGFRLRNEPWRKRKKDKIILAYRKGWMYNYSKIGIKYA
jgi:hypothetical protein